MRPHALLLLLLAVMGAAPDSSSAWTIGTAATDACHEELTMAAARDRIAEGKMLGRGNTEPPQDKRWRGLYRLFNKRLHLDLSDDTAAWQATSLLVGVRYPDIGPDSVTSANDIQRRHEDPYNSAAHFLRAPEDDYQAGDVAAFNAGDARVRQEIAATWRLLRSGDQVVRVGVYLDEYGTTTMPLWGPAFHLGVALHAFEDSFSHCIRSDDLHRVRHVMNAVEAGKYEFSRKRDGLPHSSGMDACHGAARPIARVVPTAIADLLDAVARVDDELGLNAALAKWVSYEPGCDLDNDFCESKWLDIANTEAMSPPFDCAAVAWTPRRGLIELLLTLLL